MHRAAWLWFRRIYTARETDAKTGFAIDSWKYTTGKDLEAKGLFKHGSGFVFECRLSFGENGHHLVHSARSQKKAKERLVVVGSERDATNPDAEVRCLVVDVETLRLSPGDQRCAVMASADNLKSGEPRVFTRRQGDVPEDALWLIHPYQNGLLPVEEWGTKTEELACRGIRRWLVGGEALHAARRKSRRRRYITIAKHAGMWAYWFSWSVYLVRTNDDDFNEQVWGTVGRSLLVLLFVVLGIVVVSGAKGTLRRALWFRGANGPRRDWAGGTLTAVEQGSMINSRGEISWKLWKQYVDAAPRTRAGGPVLLKELSDEHLGVACRPLENAITLAERGQWEALVLLVAADMSIPGPGLHTNGWDQEGSPTVAELAPYENFLAPLRNLQPLREACSAPGNRLPVVKAARAHLLGCLGYLAGKTPGRRCGALSASLRNRASKRSLASGLHSEMTAFANYIDTIEDDDDRISVDESLRTYFLSRWFGYKTIEAAAGEEGVAEYLDALEQATKTRRAQMWSHR